MLPTTALQISNVQGADGLHTIQSNTGIVQYATQGQDGQFYVPGMYLFIWKVQLAILFGSCSTNERSICTISNRIWC